MDIIKSDFETFVSVLEKSNLNFDYSEIQDYYEHFENLLTLKENVINFLKLYYYNLNLIIFDKDLNDLKLDIDCESVNIYFDEVVVDEVVEEMISICYYHLDEVVEDAEVSLSMVNAVDLYHTDKNTLLKRLGYTLINLK